MPPKTERLELRLESETLVSVDDWRRMQPDNPTRSEAMRRLIEIGLETSTTRPNYLLMKFQIMAAGLTPGSGDHISDAYLYAWDANVYPFDSSAKWHEPFATSFRVTKVMMDDLSEYLDGLWSHRKQIPTFYQLEDYYEVRRGTTAWDRSALMRGMRYMWISGLFDKAFWERILAPGEHPAEAGGLLRTFDREKDIYFS